MFCLYLLSPITCAVASSIQKQFPTFTFQIRKAQGGKSFTAAVSHTACSSEQENSRKTAQAPTEHGRLRHKPQDKTPRSCLNSHHLEAAPDTRAGGQTGTPQLGSPVLQGGLASTPTKHLQRGPRMRALGRARALERSVPAHGYHIQLQRAEPLGFAPQTKSQGNYL